MHNVFSRAQALDAGIEDSVLQSACGCCIASIAHGIYVIRRNCQRNLHRRLTFFVDDDPDVAIPTWKRQEREHIGLLACTRIVAPDDIVSHESAALLHGLPIISNDLRVITLTHRSKRTSARGLRRRSREIGDADIVEWPAGGLRITGAARTAADLMRDSGWQSGVMAVEAFLGGDASTWIGTSLGAAGDSARTASSRRFPLPKSERELRAARLSEAIDGHRHRRNIGRTSALANMCHGLSESPAEALAVMCFRHIGIRDYRQQVEIRGADGRFIGRVDFLLDSSRTIVEIDGEGKYLTEPGGDLADRSVLRREKVRDDELIAQGYRVIHLGWRTVVNPQEFLRVMKKHGLAG